MTTNSTIAVGLVRLRRREAAQADVAGLVR
jgi:hypothetical protein